ncbi:MAG: bifunctional [glutamate--ammonia ligase]-adenylyl-L-tyrosine phosphorylase/[glutamate--ammonia-ligase] adenylyltransferase, partial [Pseudomonadales bacterium]|nr:bifunctional [glutamate--ammonia ligase]-adenylyl-L-tyrosine phosphorylase/[glutamate--ammonia-ligase] adenylyltransferase [Pseudomonadales bacterium]
HFADVVSFEEEQTNEAMAIDEDDVILWSMRLSEESALALLLEKGFDQPERTLKNIVDLRTSRSVQVMQSQGRQRLDRFMPLLISKVAAADASSETFSRVLRLVESVVRRTAYLVLLYENPGALEQLVFLCSASPWFAEQMARTPLLLDELLNSHSLYSPPEKAELDSELQQQLLRVPVEDLEEQMEVLRHFQKAHVLRVAASELNGTLPLMKVSDYLTFIAESMLAQVLDMAWASMTAKYGYPQREPGVACGKDFVIIGYGKVGGIELGYGSDLDLVFIHDAPSNLYTDGDKSIDNVVFFTRLGQRIIHILNTQTPSGMLYEVDMRLRPSGNSGLLVSSIGAFRQYQEQDAWTWEHQALVRARPLAGSDRVAEQFMAVREAILGQSRERLKLKQDVREMREKMRVSLGTDAAEQHETFHIKHDSGGIVDLEFLVQYLVLAWSEQFPALYRWTDNIRVLEEVGECGLLPKEKTDQLTQAYIVLRSMMHKLSLQQQANTVSAQLFPQERKLISDTWSEVMLSTSDLI